MIREKYFRTLFLSNSNERASGGLFKAPLQRRIGFTETAFKNAIFHSLVNTVIYFSEAF